MYTLIRKMNVKEAEKKPNQTSVDSTMRTTTMYTE